MPRFAHVVMYASLVLITAQPMLAQGQGGGNAKGTVTSLSEGTGIDLTPDTITTTGTIAINTSVVPQKGTANTWTGTNTFQANISATNISATGDIQATQVQATSNPTTGTGVSGTGANGVRGESSSQAGNGVWGIATGEGGYGVLGVSGVEPGIGVVGQSQYGSGVIGITDSPSTGYGVFSSGPLGVNGRVELHLGDITVYGNDIVLKGGGIILKSATNLCAKVTLDNLGTGLLVTPVTCP